MKKTSDYSTDMRKSFIGNGMRQTTRRPIILPTWRKPFCNKGMSQEKAGSDYPPTRRRFSIRIISSGPVRGVGDDGSCGLLPEGLDIGPELSERPIPARRLVAMS